MDHAPFHENIKIEIPGPPLQYHTTHPISMMQPLPQFSTVLIRAGIIAGGERAHVGARGNRREKEAGEFPNAD